MDRPSDTEAFPPNVWLNTLSSSPLSTSLATEEQKLLACIHCGLCLEACPTYVVTGDENDGPRGRLYLMRAVGEGRLSNKSQAFERHIDRCLGCRACEQVCPAGVEYGQLLEAARAELFTDGPPRDSNYGVLQFALKHIWLHPGRLKFVFAVARMVRNTGLAGLLLKSRLPKLFSSRLEFGLALLVSSSSELKGQATEPNDVTITRSTDETSTVALFRGCVGSGLFDRVNRATERVLRLNGFQSSSPEHQVCCGALHAHAGDLKGARQLAKQNIEAFANGVDTSIITNAGGCGAMLASYNHLLHDDREYAERAERFSRRVRDISQQLEPVTLKNAAPATAESVTYDASCHLLYGQHAGDAPLKMLAAILPLNFKKLDGSERCCGGAGVYNVLEPDLSRRVLNEKLEQIRATGAPILASGNPGCQMQIGAGALLAGMNLTVCHPVELLDAAYARAGLYAKEGADH